MIEKLTASKYPSNLQTLKQYETEAKSEYCRNVGKSEVSTLIL